jgi:hypothetical protein
MRREMLWMLGAGLGVALSSGARAAPLETMSLAQLPPAVRETVDEEARGHKLQELASAPVPGGGTVYDVKFRTLTEGVVEMTVDQNGNMLERHNRVDDPVGDGP